MTLKIKMAVKEDQFDDEIWQLLDSADSGIKITSEEKEKNKDYDFRRTLKSDIGNWINLALIIAKSLSAALTLYKIATELKSRKQTKEKKSHGSDLFITVKGKEFNIIDLSQKEIKALINDA